jgi:hypothetical protein
MNLLRKVFFAFSMCVPVLCHAQFNDNFTDGNFTTTPTWSGDAAEFIVNPTFQLQLNNTVAGASYLSAGNTLASLNNTEWRFYIKMPFSPSSSNYGRVYLVADNANLEGPLNGYFLQFGETGSTDAVELFKQTGTTTTSVCRGTNGAIAASFNLGVKVTRDAAGLWKIFTDAAGGMAYVQEASGTDVVYNASQFIGVSCVYTASNANKFYFDDFYCGPIVVDVTSPVLVSVSTISATQVDVLYNESVDLTTAQNTANYMVNNGIGMPTLATRDASNFALVHLIFGSNFPNGTHTLTANNINDIALNTAINLTGNFSYTAPAPIVPFSVLINELLPDPAPQIGMPNYEFIELYNNTNGNINLSGWKLGDTTGAATLPNYILQPDSFLIVCSTTALPFFTSFGTAIGIVSFPSLNNASDVLVLKDNNNRIIHSVAYTDAWYQNAVKKDGGWSLELIDKANPCGGFNNYKASVNPTGGTPGKINSIAGTNTDTEKPKVTSAGVIDNTHIILYFSEALDSTQAVVLSRYSINNSIGNPTQVVCQSPMFNSVILTLAAPLVTQTVYTATVNSSVSDCSGNGLNSNFNSVQFGLPEASAAGDVLINEIVFNPKSYGYDFVEIYNNSNKILSAQNIKIATRDINGSLYTIYPIAQTNALLLPKTYYVLTEDANYIRQNYTCLSPDNFFELPSLPTFADDSDEVIILNNAGTIIDELRYSKDWHFKLLSEQDGVSIERSSFVAATQDAANWHSAAQSVGFGTPTYKNSQVIENNSSSGTISVQPAIISPDNDGFDDFSWISYTMPNSGYVGNVTIYDANGRIIKLLQKNVLLAPQGQFSWDGLDDKGLRVRTGIYIVYFEVFELGGKISKYKTEINVAAK